MAEEKVDGQIKHVGKLSFWTKGFWSIGAGAGNIMSNAHGYLAMPIYQLALGIDPALLGIAMGVPRLVDAITDPIMGHISDNTHSRFGRRRPYIFIGGILSTILFILMWMPPVFWGTGGIAMYFLVISVLYYMAYTVFAIPWGALGLELTEDYNERTKVQAFNVFVGAFSGLFLGFMWKMSMWFGDNEVEGVRVVAMIFGGIILVAAMVPAIMSKERTSIQQQKKISFKGSLLETVKNGPFMKLSVVTLMMFLGIFLVNPFALYINVNYVFGPTNEKTKIENVEKLQTTINQLRVDKIVDAVSTQRIGEIVENEALKRIGIVAENLSIKDVDTKSFKFTPADLEAVKKDVTAEGLAKTFNTVITKNLKSNYSFYDIKRLMKNDDVVNFTNELDRVCSIGLDDILAEVTVVKAVAESSVSKIALASVDELAAIKSQYNGKELENMMTTVSYALSKDRVSTFNLWGNVVFQASLMLSLPIVTWVSSKIGKKRMFITGLFLVGIGFTSSWFLYTPKVPYLQVVCLSFIGSGLASTFMLAGSIIADICDIDELKTGRRREGMFGAMYAWVTKAGQAGTLILSGFMLTMSGYSSSQIFRFQPNDAIVSMRQMYMIVPGITVVIALLVMFSTPISEKKMHEVRAKLDELKSTGKLEQPDE